MEPVKDEILKTVKHFYINKSIFNYIDSMDKIDVRLEVRTPVLISHHSANHETWRKVYFG